MLKKYLCQILYKMPSGEMRERRFACEAISPDAAMDKAVDYAIRAGDPADHAVAGRVIAVRSEPELRRVAP
jgi:hypothetical protein